VGDGQPSARIPRQSAQELAEDWLRALTITSEPGFAPERAMELIAQVNQPGRLQVRSRTPQPAKDARVLEETLAWCNDVRSRQAG